MDADMTDEAGASAEALAAEYLPDLSSDLGFT